MTTLLAGLAATAYLACALGQWRRAGAGVIAWITPAALALHAFALVGAIVQGGSLTLGVTEALSTFAWQAAVLLWILGMVQPVQVLGIAIYPLAAVAALWAALWPTPV